jgi:hypothetical protein
MAYTKRQTPFTPVVLFQPETDADKAALKMVYTLMDDVKETMNTERSQQQTIGISEIGGDCDRCLARKLSGLYVKPSDPSWKAQVGTFIHAGLEEHFQNKYGTGDPDVVNWEASDEKPRYFMERRLTIHDFGHFALAGSCDLFVQGGSFGLVDDWKTQGAAKLKVTGTGKMSSAYEVQMHTYGLGYELLGMTPTHVVLYALPRDGELWEAKPVLMRYDRQIALNALARIQNMIDAALLLESAFPGLGWEKLIDAQDRAGQCFDCAAYERLESSSLFDNITGGN